MGVSRDPGNKEVLFVEVLIRVREFQARGFRSGEHADPEALNSENL